jgi:hypothetical protein
VVKNKKNSGIKKTAYLPTPEQIAVEAEKIREEWIEKMQEKDWKGTQRLIPKKVYKLPTE